MNANTKDHFSNLLKALKVEKREEIEHYASLTSQADYAQRIIEGITLYPIEFLDRNYNDFGEQLIHIKCSDQQEGGAFKVGKSVEIFNADGENAQGQVTFFQNQLLTIKCSDDQIEDWIKKGKVGINALADTKTYDSLELALDGLLKSEKKGLVEQFYETNNADTISHHFKSSELNESQNVAVNTILSSNPISIVHGPPGTGKTTTLVAAIEELAKQNKKILVCAPSNTAVDHLCRKLITKKVETVRIGNESKIDEDILPVYLDQKIREDASFKLVKQLKNQSDEVRKKAFKFKRNFGKEEYQERKRLKQELSALRSDIRKIQKDITQTILENATVICGTFFSIQQFNLPFEQYDYLFIDEAGQALEPSIWSVSHLADKMVLCGDDWQLPPTVKSVEAQKLGLHKSILEKAREIEFPMCLLNVQYRMNELIMAFSNEQFYHNQLQAHESVAKWSIKGNLYAVVEFIDTAGCGYEEEKNENSGGIRNSGEVGILQKVVEEYSDVSIGIITPYRYQLEEIRSALEKYDANTIDSFQGQEREVILISLVRSNENGEIGFLNDYRRMNVAMTRAKKKLVVIGDSATIGLDKFYGDFIDFVEQNGSYRSGWEFM